MSEADLGSAERVGMIPYVKADWPDGMPKSMVQVGGEDTIGYLHPQGALNRQGRRKVRAYLRGLGMSNFDIEVMRAEQKKAQAHLAAEEAQRMLDEMERENRWYNRATRWLRRKGRNK